MRLIAALAAIGAVDLPGVPLADAPQTVAQVHQALRIQQELAHWRPMAIANPSYALLNLYGNYTLTQIPPPHAYQNFLPGVRVQVRGSEIFYGPSPSEVAEWMTSRPDRYKTEFAAPAAHLLVFLQETLKRHKVPDVDVVFLIADFCFGFAREPELWGLGQSPVSFPPNEPPALLTSTKVPPLFSWNTARSGRRTCNAVTTTSYDWTWPAALPGLDAGLAREPDRGRGAGAPRAARAPAQGHGREDRG